ncbi:hypothetical protein AB0E69_36070 [Kribbella sp. NPDC026611]|uniref:hypothetical protein n=1 Tax=Kribbella sp. NPDC026611 TaxID=3154911 RepID=UPI0033E04C8F
MEALFDLPSGDRIRVVDTATAGQSLSRILQLHRAGNTEPVFFGDQPRPEGVVITFEQWAEYEALKAEAEADRRQDQTVRERLNNAAPEDYVRYEDMLKELGIEDPDPGDQR